MLPVLIVAHALAFFMGICHAESVKKLLSFSLFSFIILSLLFIFSFIIVPDSFAVGQTCTNSPKFPSLAKPCTDPGDICDTSKLTPDSRCVNDQICVGICINPNAPDCTCDNPNITGAGKNGYTCSGKHDFCEFGNSACVPDPGNLNGNKGQNIKGVKCSSPKYDNCTCENAGKPEKGKNGFTCDLPGQSGQKTQTIYCSVPEEACVKKDGTNHIYTYKTPPYNMSAADVVGISCVKVDQDKADCRCDTPNVSGAGDNGFTCQPTGQKEPKHYWCDDSKKACKDIPGKVFEMDGDKYVGIECSEPTADACICDNPDTAESGLNGFTCNFNGFPLHNFCDHSDQACIQKCKFTPTESTCLSRCKLTDPDYKTCYDNCTPQYKKCADNKDNQIKLDNKVIMRGITCKNPSKTDESIAPTPPCATAFDPATGECPSFNTAFGAFNTVPADFITRIFALILGLSGGIALILIMRAGYVLMTSRGKPEQVQQGRDQLIAAIVGLLFIIFSFVILQVIGVDILKIPTAKQPGAVNSQCTVTAQSATGGCGKGMICATTGGTKTGTCRPNVQNGIPKGGACTQKAAGAGCAPGLGCVNGTCQ